MKCFTFALTAAVLFATNVWAQTNTLNSVSIGTATTAGGTAAGVAVVTPLIGTAGNQPGSVLNNLAGIQYISGQIPFTGSPASIAFYALSGAAIPGGAANPASAVTSYGTLTSPTTVTTYADPASKLTANSYSGLTFASANLGFGSSNFYMIHHTPGTDYFSEIVPGTGTATLVADLKPMSWGGPTAGGPASIGTTGYFGIAWATGILSAGAPYADQSIYYLRTSVSSHTIFGVMVPALTSASSDTLDLTTAVGAFGAGGYTTLAFSPSAVGPYGANQFYYLRLDPITGNTILGWLNPSLVAGVRTVSDIANLGGVFNTLTFAPDATGPAGSWGSGQFYATGSLAAGAQSLSFAAIPNHNVGDVFTVTPTASSGLDIDLTVVSGPATVQETGVSGATPSSLRIFTVTTTGPGIVTLQARQAGRSAAPAFNANLLQQSFNVIGAPIITNTPLTAAGSVGTALTFTITALGSPTSFTASPLPAGLTLATATGIISGTPTATGTTNVLLGATNSTGTGNATLVITVAAAGVAPVISNTPLTAAGTVGTLFSFTITASGTPTAYTATPLPPGLSIVAATGVITGTPTATGTTNVLLGATNSSGTGNATLVVTVASAGIAPIITNSPLTAAGTVGTPFSFTTTASGTPTAYTATPLPAGLSIVAATGVITGTPTATGTTNVLLGATNSSGTGNATLVVTVASAGVAPIITNSPLTAAGTVGTPFSFTTTASGIPTVYTATPLPAGLSIVAATGVITGTPTATGTTNVLLGATNSSGTGNATLVVTVAGAGAAPIITNSPLTAAGTVGTPFSFTTTASGTPTAYTATPLPAGLSIVAATGVITGTPTATGTTNVLLGATNGSGTGNATLVITVASAGIAPIITNSPLTAAGTVGTPFSFTTTASGTPTVYTATPLPIGLSIVAATGAITGTPIATGTTYVLLGATNASGTGNATLVITVASAGLAPIIANSPLTAAGTVGTPFSFTIAASGLPFAYGAAPLPPGLHVVAATGVITGTPTTPGTTFVQLGATNGIGSGFSTLEIIVAAAGVAPIITNNPLAAAGTIGTPFSFTITASGLPTSYSAAPLPAGLTIVALTGVITGTPTAVGTTVVNLGTANGAGIGNATLTITVAAAGVAPTITNTPLTATGYVGIPFGFTVAASNLPTSYTASPLPAGLTIIAATGVIAGTPTASGTTVVTLAATNATGTGNATLSITIAAAPVTPVVTTQPTGGSVVTGGTVTLSAGASGTPSPTYQWYDNGVAIAGATGATLTLNNAQAGTAGSYTVTISNVGGTVTSAPATVAVTFCHITDFSGLVLAGPGNEVLTLGFVLSGSKTVLVRGIGPDLASFGIKNPMPDPLLTLNNASMVMASDAGWQTAPANTTIAALSAQFGAFALPAGSLDSALVATLPGGAYTAQVVSANSVSTGTALAEVYDADMNTNARLINASALLMVNQGGGNINPVTIGFIIEGTGTKTVLIRGDGPSLVHFGVTGVLVDPQISVFSGGALLASNAGWQSGGNATQLSATFAQVFAFPLDSGSNDCAVMLTLQPGSYTVQVTSVGNHSGTALIEIYDVQ